MEKRIKDAIARARADYVEIRVHHGSGTAITYAGKELEQIGETTGLGGCVRALVGGGWGFVSFNEMDDLEKYVGMACAQARLVGDAGVRLAKTAPQHATVAIAMEMDPAEQSLADKQAVCEKYNGIILKNEKIQTSSVRYRDSAGTILFANSEGSFITQGLTFCGISLMALAKDGMNVQYAFDSVGDLRGYRQVLGLEGKCEELTKRAIDLLTAEPVRAGKHTVVIDPKLCGVFVHEAFGHLSEADFIHENERLREIMAMGRRFGADALAIVDDGTMEGEAGSIFFDSEGTPSHKTDLIRGGALVGRLHSRETAAKMDEAPTGNARAISSSHMPIVRMTNTYMEPREWTFEGMLDGVADGIYAIGAIGGMTNSEMFTFSAEEAYEIRNGALGKKLRDVVLTGNVFETLKNIDAIGNDLQIHGGLGGCGKGGQSPLRTGTGGPHVRIRNVVIGGR